MAARWGLALLAVVLVAGACNSGSGRPGQVFEGSSTVPPTTSPPTTALGRPRPSSTVPVGIAGGQARIRGAVVGPQGPVQDAIVRIERFVGSEVDTVDLRAGGGGSFDLGDVRGGRYRVRAWKQPDLVQLEPEVFFLAADENTNLDLRLEKTSDVSIRTTTDPRRLPAEETFEITVFLYAGSVGPEGELQVVPRSGVDVQIVPGPGFAVVGSDRGTTDSSGNVTYGARCTRAGPPGGDVIFSTFKLPLDLPTCPS